MTCANIVKLCLQCNKSHKRKKFCSNKCKDRYHNIHNPRGKFAHLKNIGHDDICHPYSSEALGQD
jgi:hypothetical protein